MSSMASSGKPKIVYAAIASSSLVEPNHNPNRHGSSKWARTALPEDLEMTTNDKSNQGFKLLTTWHAMVLHTTSTKNPDRMLIH